MSFRLEVDPDQIRDAGERAPRRGLLVAVVAALVLGSVAAGGWAAWRILSHRGSGGAVPLIHADLRPIKVPPTDPGGMTVPDQDKYILNRGSLTEPRVEQLLPPPEAPLPRPVPAEPVMTEAAPAAAPLAAAPLPVAHAIDPTPSVAVAAAPAAAVAPTPATVASPVRPAAVESGGAVRLQVGAVRTPEDADREWARLKRAQPDILGALGERTVRVDRGAQGVFYRIEVGPLADAAAATRACDQLKQRKVGCILVKP